MVHISKQVIIFIKCCPKIRESNIQQKTIYCLSKLPKNRTIPIQFGPE